MTCLKVFSLWIFLWPIDADCPVHKFWPSTASSAVVSQQSHVAIASPKSTPTPRIKLPPLLISYISETSVRSFSDERSWMSCCVVTFFALSLICFEDSPGQMPFDSIKVTFQIDSREQSES